MPRAGPAQVGAQVVAAGALGGGEPLAQRVRGRVDLDELARVSGSFMTTTPASGSWTSLGSMTEMAMTAWRTATARSARCQPSPPRKSETTTTSPWCDAARRTRHSAFASASGRTGPSGATPSSSTWPTRASVRRPPRGGRTRSFGAPAVSIAIRPPRRSASWEMTLHGALGDVALQPVGGPEGHRRRDVEHDPRRQRPLGDVQPHVGHAGPRARRRVEVAHVVADLVRAKLRELGAEADAGRAVLTGERAAGPARERQVEQLQRSSGERARTLSAGRRSQPGAAHPTGPRSSTAVGADTDSGVTTLITRSRIESGEMPSASAS